MGTTQDLANKQDRGERALVEQLVHLAKRIRERLAERCEAEGISASRFAVLQAMTCVGDDGCSQTELASLLQLSESNVCSLIERMRSSGLLFRFRSKADRRKSVLMLSDDGKHLAEALSCSQTLEATCLLSALAAPQRAVLADLLQQLSDHLDASPPIVVASDDAAEEVSENAASFSSAPATHPIERVIRRAS